MANRFERVLGIDRRSLAVFRTALGALLCTDLAIRACDLTAHYTDSGTAPRWVIDRQFADTWRWSLHMLSGSAAFQASLFALAAVAALALMVGYRTRTATCLSWLLCVSLHNRNPAVLNGGDVLLRMLLFWSMFLPLGSVWSVDRRARRADDKRNPPDLSNEPVMSMATVAVLLQVAVVYWMSAWFKLQGVWGKPDGFERLLEFDSYARPFAYWLAQHDAWLPTIGHTILAWEILGPLLAFSPIATRALRAIVLTGMLLLHAGIELSFTVGLFSYVSLTGWLLFVPGSWWTALSGSRAIGSGAIGSGASESGAARCAHRTRTERTMDLVVGLLLAYVLVWNLATTHAGWMRRLRLARATRPAQLVLLQQKWNMFSIAARHDGWFVVVARLRDGRSVDLMRGGQPADWDSFRQPTLIYRRMPNHRWRKFYRNLASGRGNRFLKPLAHYLAEQWNRAHPDSSRVVSIEIHFMEQIGQPHEHDRFMQRLLYIEDFAPSRAPSAESAD